MKTPTERESNMIPRKQSMKNMLFAVANLNENPSPKKTTQFFQALGDFVAWHITGEIDMITDVDGSVTLKFTPKK